MMRTFCRNRFWKVESDQFIIIFCRSFDVPVKMIAVNRFELVLINTQPVWCWGRQNQTIHTENKSNPAWQWQPTVVFFNLFVAAVKPSATVCVARGTLCNDPGVYIAITALNCGGEFRSRQFRSVSAEPLAATRGTPVEEDWRAVFFTTIWNRQMKIGRGRNIGEVSAGDGTTIILIPVIAL